MYTDYFAELLRAFSPLASRRGVLAGAVSGLFAVQPAPPGAAEGVAKQNGKRQKKRKRKKNNKQLDSTPAPPPPAPPPPGPVTRADATCTGSGETGLGSTDGNTRLAQTFTALSSGALVRAELPLVKEAGSNGEYILRLSPVDGSGFPTNEVLAAAAVSNLSVPNGPSIVAFTFAGSVALVAGTQYALVLTRPGSTHLQWKGDFDGACPGSSFVSTDQTAPFVTSNPDHDLIFTIVVQA